MGNAFVEVLIEMKKGENFLPDVEIKILSSRRETDETCGYTYFKLNVWKKEIPSLISQKILQSKITV
jgi:hypothetical protein